MPYVTTVKKQPIALLIEDIPHTAVRALTDAGFVVRTHAHVLSEDELIREVRDCTLLGIRWKTQITDRVLAAAPHLLAIGAFCIGTNHIAMRTATEKGIAVFNAPFSSTRSVVEFAIAEIIMLFRRLADKNVYTHAGVWEESAVRCFEIRGRTLGIVGYGRIGSQLSIVAEALGMKVIFHDIAYRLPLGNARSMSSLEDLLSQADVVSLTVDGRPENEGLIGDKEFACMRKGTYLLNVSRGMVVTIDALVKALNAGHLGGAAIDVFPDEPIHGSDSFCSSLQGLPNVILTPHIGGSTEEAHADIGEFVSARLIDYIRTGSTDMCVYENDFAHNRASFQVY